VPLEDYRVAFIESTHLIAIANTFKRIRGPRFKQKVRNAVVGPAHPLDEKKSGSKARDLLFELSVAAYFRKRGFPVLICSDKDAILRMPGYTIMIECKRPQSKKRVCRLIKEATSQLIKHFNNYIRGGALRGFIVLDISVVMNPERMLLIGDSVDAIAHEATALFKRFLADFRPTNNPFTRIHGGDSPEP
jgi:hypothetical protein